MSRKTALFEQHLQQGAMIFNFADWQMPLHYGSQIQEHHIVRQDAGVFDISHMLAIDINGKEAAPFLRKILANDVAKLHPGKGLYSCLLNDTAGILDDLIVYRLGHTSYRCVVNAGTREKDLQWFTEYAKPFDVSIDAREDIAMLAIQGPLVKQKIQPLFTSKDYEVIQSLKSFHIHQINDWVVARTGYTGEDGFEIMLPQNEVIGFWNKVRALHIAPIGLGARDSLRLEAGLNLYGVDMDESMTPDESNLGWTVDVKDPQRHFIGKNAMITQRKLGIEKKLVGVILTEKGVCRAHMAVYAKITDHDNFIGKITSGGFSPTLGCGIAFARIVNDEISQVQVEIRGKRIGAKIIKLPFVKNGKANC